MDCSSGLEIHTISERSQEGLVCFLSSWASVPFEETHLYVLDADRRAAQILEAREDPFSGREIDVEASELSRVCGSNPDIVGSIYLTSHRPEVNSAFLGLTLDDRIVYGLELERDAAADPWAPEGTPARADLDALGALVMRFTADMNGMEGLCTSETPPCMSTRAWRDLAASRASALHCRRRPL